MMIPNTSHSLNLLKKKITPSKVSGIPYVKQTDFLGPFNNTKSTGKAFRHSENFAIGLNLIGQGGKTLVKQREIHYGYLKFASPCIITQFKQINQLDAPISQVYYLSTCPSSGAQQLQ